MHCRLPPSEGGPTIRDLAELRICGRCGEVGRVNAQGVVVATGMRINQELHDVI